MHIMKNQQFETIHICWNVQIDARENKIGTLQTYTRSKSDTDHISRFCSIIRILEIFL